MVQTDVRNRKRSKSTQSNKLENEIHNGNILTIICHKLFSWLPQKYEKILTRSLLGVILVLLLWIIIYIGVPAIIAFFTFIVCKCYSEIISVGYRQYKELSLPLFRFLQWFFLFSANIFASGDIFAMAIDSVFKIHYFTPIFLNSHRITAFGFYIIGIIIFVLNLKKKKYRIQFSIFAWYQLTLMILMIPSQFLLRTIFHGLIWVFLPMSLIIINDTFAYFFGITFGKTPLIKLSPKKTWEGFIGGAFSTIIGAIVMCNIMMQYQSFYCPVKFDIKTLEYISLCDKPNVFQTKRYDILLPNIINDILQKFGFNEIFINWCPMYKHAIIMGLFASLISPFGGFFASGFKRAFKVKDFGDSIPGHGGMMDRMDCQILMCIFVNLYIQTIIKEPTPTQLINLFMKLSPINQYEVYTQIKNYIKIHNLGEY